MEEIHLEDELRGLGVGVQRDLEHADVVQLDDLVAETDDECLREELLVSDLRVGDELDLSPIRYGMLTSINPELWVMFCLFWLFSTWYGWLTCLSKMLTLSW